ncbi:response regulator [Brunnivagina elsteri]|uniref:Protein PatA n=1 Tax=Brunnivagina elsteri CCALA 953 TaxID=987040 RepID=A0A2A2TM86_9CYAN|nr:response regulator [Calothrix elsteri]PAX59489.1 two-component system response regulator [Calothrix elsteri CCALA 953]
MSTTPLDSYRVFQKLHPLSLLAQLTSRRATGCLKVLTGAISWSLYLYEGKLTYASYSNQLFDWLDGHLERLSKQVPALNSSTRMQMRLLFESKHDNQSIGQADYQAICWLVNRNYISSEQAATLIEELAKEVLESFLVLKEGSYEFQRETALDELPKFCSLDLRVLVESCQRHLRSRYHNSSSSNAIATSVSDEQEGSYSAAVEAQQGVESSSSLFEQREKQLSRNIRVDSVANNNEISQPQQSTKVYTIACIDDSPTVLNSINHFLDQSNFTVVMINDPVKALMQILRSKPDLILLDVEMPNLDGYELCSLLRRHSIFKDIPIIMVTGRTGFIDRAKAKLVRSSGYLTKPFTQSELLKMIFKYIN